VYGEDSPPSAYMLRKEWQITYNRVFSVETANKAKNHLLLNLYVRNILTISWKVSL
jgi:hypothetical protein